MKRFRYRKCLIDAASGFETPIHEFALPFHEGETAFGMRALPFIKEVGPINLGASIRTGFVRTERAGKSRQHHLGRAKIDRIFPARNPDKILQPAGLSVSCFATEKNAVVAWIAKRKSSAATSVLRGENQLRVPRRRQRPGNLRSDTAQPIRAEQAAMDQRVIRKIPNVRMLWIQPAEGGEELATLQLQTERQVRCLHKRFFDFDLGFIVVIEFENNVGEPFEVRIDRAIEGELDITGVESALLRIVIAHFDVRQIACARSSESKHAVEGNVHVILAAARDCDWLRERAAC